MSSSPAAPTISAAFSGVLGDLVLRDPQRQAERDEPLLGAVVQVALQPPALLAGPPRRCGRASAAARPPGARSASPGPAAAATVLRTSGSARRLRSCTIAPTRWPSSSTGVHARSRGDLGRVAVALDPAAVDPVEDLQARVVERLGQQAAQAVGARRLAEADEQRADRVGARDAVAQQAGQERERHAGEDDLAEQHQHGADVALVAGDGLGADRAGDQDHQHDARPQQRRERLPAGAAGGAPARGQDLDEVADEPDRDGGRQRVGDRPDRRGSPRPGSPSGGQSVQCASKPNIRNGAGPRIAST